MSNNAALKSICVAFPKFIALIEGVFQVYLVLACMTISCRSEARAFVFQSEQVQTVRLHIFEMLCITNGVFLLSDYFHSVL